MQSRDTAAVVEVFEYAEMPWLRERDGLTESELSVLFAEVFPRADFAESETRRRDGNKPPQGQSHNSTVDPGESRRKEPDNVGEGEFSQQVDKESRVAEERGFRRGFEVGHARGVADALTQAQDEAAELLQVERDRLYSQARGLIQSFAETRDGYLHELEGESVKLALAIAARILRREAQMDPLLLTGAVRVALGQLADSTAVRLRVPEQDEELWREAIARIPALHLRPVVVGDARMELGDCRVETEFGSADLGLWAQLKEIERGFFDRVSEPLNDTDVEALGLSTEAVMQEPAMSSSEQGS